MLLVVRFIPRKFCPDRLKLEWITKYEDRDSTKRFRPVFFELTENKYLCYSIYFHKLQNIFSPKPKIQLIQHVSLKHAELVNNN